jgi:hypothetical protein
VSKTEYYGFDAKLKVLSTEQSAVNTGRKVRRAEKSAISTRRSSVEHRVTGAGAELSD